MICPACGNRLREIAVSGVTVDACDQGCGGLWFDHLELVKFDEPSEVAGDELLGIARRAELKLRDRASRTCPRCKDISLFRHFYSVKRRVEVDECNRCGGIWLDAGELALIRNQYDSQEERKAAAKAYFRDVFDSELAEMSKAGGESEQKAIRIMNVLRFICPCQYLSGKRRGRAS